MPKFSYGLWEVDSDNDVQLGGSGGFALLDNNNPDTPHNARLIAEAPVMYRLLQMLIPHLPDQAVRLGEVDWPRMRLMGLEIFKRVEGGQSDVQDCP